MIDFLFGTLVGMLSLTALAVLACVAVAWFFPQVRLHAVVIGGAILSYGFAFARGWAAHKRKVRTEQDALAARKEEQYNEIDRRNDQPSDLTRRLRDGTF